jgi:hypothetical protein
MIVNGVRSAIAIHESWHVKVGIASQLFRNACSIFIFVKNLAMMIYRVK